MFDSDSILKQIDSLSEQSESESDFLSVFFFFLGTRLFHNCGKTVVDC